MKEASVFVLHHDPEGAFLEVTIGELCVAGVHPGELTAHCRHNRQWMYLPFADADLFIDRWTKRFPESVVNIIDRWDNARSFIRSLTPHHPMTPEQLRKKLAALGYTMEDLDNATR